MISLEKMMHRGEKHGFYLHTHVQVLELRKESAKGEIIFPEKNDQSRSALHVDQNRPPLC